LRIFRPLTASKHAFFASLSPERVMTIPLRHARMVSRLARGLSVIGAATKKTINSTTKVSAPAR
jgi:ribosomal protein L31E